MKGQNAEKSAAKRLANIWYYYWKFILIGLAVAVVAAVLIVNLVVKPADVKVILFSRSAAQLDLNTVREAFVDYTPDRNGDRTIALEISSHSPADGENAFTDSQVGVLQNSDTYLYLIDANLFKELQALPDGKNIPEGFADLTLKSPGCVYIENNGYNIIGSPFQEKLGISAEDAETYFPDGLYLVLRGPVIVYDPGADQNITKTDYADAETFMINILRDTPEERN